MAEALPHFPKFDLSEDAGAKGPRWKKYVTRFKNLTVALNIANLPRQRALLLHYVGEDVNEIFDTLPNTEPQEDEDTLEKAIKALTLHFEDKKNIVFEEYRFRKARQEEHEAIMAYHTRLRNLAKTCEFTDVDREIKAQIVQHCSSTKVRRKGLTNNVSLQVLLEYGRTLELTETRVADLEEKPATQEINKLQRKPDTWRRKNRNGKPRTEQRGSPRKSDAKCRNCGGHYPHEGGMSACPAHDKECLNCGKMNHFQKFCMSRPRPQQSTQSSKPQYSQRRNRQPALHKISDSDDSDEDVFIIDIRSIRDNRDKHPMFKVKVSDTWLDLMADSGSSINLLDEADFKKLKPHPKLEHTNAKIYPYKSDNTLPILGKFQAFIEAANSTKVKSTIYVTEGTGGSLLSWRTSEDLGLIKIASPLKAPGAETEVEQLVREYDDLFHGLGKLKGRQVKIHVDETIPPVAQPHRRVPFHVRKQLEEQLEKDEQQGVIERIDGPTPWVSPVVVVPKKEPGKIRVCVDMRQANQAIQRERHLTPTIKEIIKALNGATVFSKLDLNQGYNQLELAPESRTITTFSTHLGLRRYKRLNFGVSSASEIFQNAICETLAGIPGAINLSDDILVYGKTQKEHNDSLRATFQRLKDSGLTLNKKKCVYNQPSLEFFGYVFSAEGMSPDPKKIEEIVNLEAPSNASEVRSFLGMTNYCSRFIHSYSTMTQPLRELTKKEQPWQWTDHHQQALQQVKDALVKASTTAYFDPDKETEISVDASPVGLGAILSQLDPKTGERHIVTYASRSLSDTETRYSQTEREALGVVWSCEYFHLYIYGKPVTVYTDHKPLVHIYSNPKSKPPARLERWSLRLQPYQVTVAYRRGEDNPADYMSRHPTKQQVSTSRQEKVAEEFVDYITQTSTPKALKIQDIEEATKRDPTLQAVSEAIYIGNWFEPAKRLDINTDTYKAMERAKDELTVCSTHSVILRGTRIVIPSSLQHRIIDLAHEGHQGIAKTKSMLREKVWFHGINKLVEKKIASCSACQIATPKTKREPLKMSPLPTSPWQEVSIDFKDLSSGEYLLVITDDYSRYPVVEIVRSTSAKAVIPKLDKVFAEFGIPEVVRSDNGPPFNGQDFKQFAETLGFKHRKVTPLWPRSNGEVERFMRTLKKAIHTATLDNKPWKTELCKFLRNYRSTPHTSTGIAPATALFGRSMNNKLPEAPRSPPDLKEIRQRDNLAKAKMKAYADAKAYVKPSSISVGDSVLVKRDPSDKKSQPPYRPEHFVVTQKKGSMVTAKGDSKTITRNSSFFKQVPATSSHDNHDEHSYAEEEEAMVQPPGGKKVDEHKNPEISSPEVATERRYPQRNRRPPSYLKDYLT